MSDFAAPRSERIWDRRILALALPAFGSSVVPLVHRQIDMAWCKSLGTDATAGLTVSTVSVWIYISLGILIAIGLGALVARYVGAGRQAAAQYVGSQGLRWSLVVGVLGAGLGYVGAPWLFEAAQAAPAVADQGIPYTRVYWGGGAFVMLCFAGDAIFRAQGNTRTPLRIGLTALTINVVLDPLFIFGWGPIPGGGVTGAAIATILSTAIAAGLYLRALRAAGHRRRERPTDEELRLTPRTRLGQPQLLGLDRTVLRRIVRVGFPASLASVFFNVVTLILMRCAQEASGPAAQAGMGVGYLGEGVAYVMGLGWSAAAATLVGQRLGAGDPAAAASYAWRTVTQCAILSGIWGVVMFVFAEPLATAFAEAPDAVHYGVAYYRIIAFCLAFQAIELVLNGAFGGAGHTTPPMVIAIITSGVRIPLAYYAAFDLDMGAEGVFWVIAITALLRGLIMGWWFRRGTWKTREV